MLKSEKVFKQFKMSYILVKKNFQDWESKNFTYFCNSF
ncbi:hypothetical protein NC99_39990 [Sunxiuqinia dokdonensis]|uniref:Uncharacterized protein n=1 Tax=Sunxiuqinia dokdonensis TaxID=1409788 RepID=A0A0L8V3X8_9BACT|nr:hypothetical protein NC99_39990 [Sunxiuqinia dokdonensis]